nr:hypothetical protein [Nitrosomonas nitrosa]
MVDNKQQNQASPDEQQQFADQFGNALRRSMEKQADQTRSGLETLAAEYGGLDPNLATMFEEMLGQVRDLPLEIEERYKHRAKRILEVAEPVLDNDVIEGEFQEIDGDYQHEKPDEDAPGERRE